MALPLNFLTSFNCLIDVYNKAIATPREAITYRSAAGNELKKLIKRMDIILNDRLDMLMGTLKKDNPKFHSQYNNARIIVDFGGRSGGGPEAPPKPGIPPVG